jgi:hypothetical protein
LILAYDSLAHQAGRALFDHADKFMPQHASVRIIALDQFQIGITDAGLQNPHQRLTPWTLR